MTNDKTYQKNLKMLSYNLFSSVVIMILLIIDIVFYYTHFKIFNLLTSIIVSIIIVLLFSTYGIYLLIRRCSEDNKLDKSTAVLDFVAMFLLLIKVCVTLNMKATGFDGKYFNSAIDILFSVILWISLVLKYLPNDNLFRGNTVFASIVGILLMLFLNLFLKFYNNKIIMIISSLVISVFLVVLLLKMVMVDKIKVNTIGSVFKFVLLLLLNIVLNIYLIYLLFWNFDIKATNQDLFLAISGIYGCIIGGVLTLGGVAWTINKGREDAKQLRKETIRPFFYGTPYYQGPNGDKKTSTYKRFGNVEEKCCINIGMILNSDKIEFLLKKLIINNKEYTSFEDSCVSKSELFEIYICSNEFEDKTKFPSNVSLIIEDVDNNEIKYEITLKKSTNYFIPEKIVCLK